ncbi:hypothetical protein ACH3O9_17900 [Leeuwenhoekiella sp. A16]|uniref:hypothetical protein n=1 Tax=Leeuwenhoekiella sp. A16 TaxID=3141462 RepID=UPI003A80961E
MTDTILIEKLEFFRNRFESEDNEIKNQIHYQSVINVTTQLLKIANKIQTEPYRLAGVNFFDHIEKIDFPLGKSESLELYKNYILYTGRYLIRKKDFRTGADIGKYLIGGILLDSIAYYFTRSMFSFYFPIFTLIFGLLGLKSRRSKKNKMQYFSIGY